MLPPRFPTTWVAEESCRRVAEAVRDLAPAEAEALLYRAANFLDEVLLVVKRDELPFEPEECLFVDFVGRLHLVGARRGNKLRVDEDMNVLLVRAKPLELSGPRAGSLRGEVRDLVPFTLASIDRRPVAAVRTIDLASASGPGAFFVELDAPLGGGYVGGRFDRLRVFGDGKVLALSLRPISLGDEAADAYGEGGGLGGGDGALEGWRSRGKGFDDSGSFGGLGDRDAAPVVPPPGGFASSDSPFDQPGWAASVAPALPK
jgi:hypothetical protein